MRKATNVRALQRKFFAAAGDNLRLLKEMFDRLPNVSSYIKDAQGRFMAINRRNCEQCGFESEDEIIGKRSCDLFAPEIASYIMERDRSVVETGEPIVDRRELRSAKNPSDPIVISIYPIRNAKGGIIGTAGVYYKREDDPPLPNSERLGNVIAYLNRHFTEPLAIQDLPRKFNLSAATFYRTFVRTVRTTPIRYLTSLRIERARKLLETTDQPITAIAQSCGFCDHSHFVHAFRRERGITPGEYRRRHRRIS